MNFINGAIFENLLRARDRILGGGPRERQDEELPLRSELFGVEQMEQHGKALANSHKLSTERIPDQLLSRLAENHAILVATSELLTETVKENRRIAPAGEWLLDNFYLIEDQIRMAVRHLPKGYSKELPRLARGPSARSRSRVLVATRAPTRRRFSISARRSMMGIAHNSPNLSAVTFW